MKDEFKNRAQDNNILKYDVSVNSIDCKLIIESGVYIQFCLLNSSAALLHAHIYVDLFL